ncbi:hypothetical protein TNIN_465901 [Trichonephila inaurata madagascariensis]|uniref:Uncharacterized protein n=1 Tax=Trichonephila inaurata madagascariensis TaxID=2747483 RepID=A0A8X6WMI9_9ARAC|nr:hypothetical protein TNIN_465901 [Trichonephila inaurata madagascariensis]
MPFKLKAWLIVKLGLRGSSIPYKDEHGSSSEEVEMEPIISFDCAYCAYQSPTQKGLRCHHITAPSPPPFLTLATQKRPIELISRGGDLFIRVIKMLFGLRVFTLMNCLGPHSYHISIYLHNM